MQAGAPPPVPLVADATRERGGSQEGFRYSEVGPDDLGVTTSCRTRARNRARLRRSAQAPIRTVQDHHLPIVNGRDGAQWRRGSVHAVNQRTSTGNPRERAPVYNKGGRIPFCRPVLRQELEDSLLSDLRGRSVMRLPDYFRQLARRCLGLSKTAVEPEIIEQMQVWAVDLADEADQAEHRERQLGTVHRKRRGRAAETTDHGPRRRSRLHWKMGEVGLWLSHGPSLLMAPNGAKSVGGA